MGTTAEQRVAEVLAERQEALAAGVRTWAELARVMGVDQGNLRRYLRGDRVLVRSGRAKVTAAKVAGALGVSVDAVIGSGDGA